jgi:hypothetical protein
MMSVAAGGRRAHLRVRGIYGGVPTRLFAKGQTLDDQGVNAVFLGSGSITSETLGLLKPQGVQVFAEFNSMHDAAYLVEHSDAAPIGLDGQVCPPPDGWQGVCPTHPGYRQERMAAFRAVLERHPVDGIWLDYHHSHASWEQAIPNLPDTCFCDRCIARFAADTGLRLPREPTAALSQRLLGEHRERWTQWRCDLFTGWMPEFRAIRDETRPAALLGSFHCPWTETDYDGALRNKLAIDLKAQARYLDVFSPMPYHARFGHADDPTWISRQVEWLGRYLGIAGEAGERQKIWPIVQLSDWGESVPVTQVQAVLEHGTRLPATGVMVFAWGSLGDQREKVEGMVAFYRSIRSSS